MAESESPLVALGIDFGTHNSCASVFQEGGAKMVLNQEGHAATPSVVAFNDVERLIGDSAISQRVHNPRNTITNIKRLIGRNFEDPQFRKVLHLLPFTVLNCSEKLKIKILYKETPRLLAPEQLASFIMRKLKNDAEKLLRIKADDCVLAVPTFFNNSQRIASRNAATIAGLNVLKLINEPTAAAIAYGLEKNVEEKKNILIYDLGGGTFDVSILTIEKPSVFKVIATAGDTLLGGEDFTKKIMELLIQAFKDKVGGDVTTSPHSLEKVHRESERAKKILSSCYETTIHIDSLFEGIDFSIKLSRYRFEAACMDLFQCTLNLVTKALNDAGMIKKDIKEIILIGGSSRIPKIQELLSDYFDNMVLNCSINPDHAVATGAALYAASLIKKKDVPKIILHDVLPLTLGLELAGGIMQPMIRRNERIPCKITKKFIPDRDNQDVVAARVFEGEERWTALNHYLGCISLSNLVQRLCDDTLIEITFEVKEDGFFGVTACEKNTGKTESISIRNANAQLSEVEIGRMMRLTTDYEAEDRRNQAKMQLKSFIDFIKEKSQQLPNLTASDIQLIHTHCDCDLSWLEERESVPPEEIIKRLESLQVNIHLIVKRIGDKLLSELNLK